MSPPPQQKIDPEPRNPWTPQDEGDHIPIKKEWWTTILFFTSQDDHRDWALWTVLSHLEKPDSCFYQYILFDITNKRCILHKNLNDKPSEQTTAKNRVDVRYKHTTLQGLYPTYHQHNQEDDHQFTTDIDITARSLPHWVTQDTTNGLLPSGLNYYRYGFIPHCTLNGTMTLNGKTSSITGKGYFEHAYGNWSYENPLQSFSGIRTTLGVYLKLMYWWLSQHHHHIPTRIGFTTENNMLGYDWFWGILNNNASFFFGNTLLYLNDGPSMGPLYLTLDGKHYLEFCDLHFKYHKLLYVKDYDTYYPSDMEITGRLDDKTINLKFTSTTPGYEYTDPNNQRDFYTAFILALLPGHVTGTLNDNGHIIPLNGLSASAPARQAPRRGHTSIHFTCQKPPYGLGLKVDYESHPKKKKTTTIVQLAPRPKFTHTSSRIDLSKIPRETILP